MICWAFRLRSYSSTVLVITNTFFQFLVISDESDRGNRGKQMGSFMKGTMKEKRKEQVIAMLRTEINYYNVPVSEVWKKGQLSTFFAKVTMTLQFLWLLWAVG